MTYWNRPVVRAQRGPPAHSPPSSSVSPTPPPRKVKLSPPVTDSTAKHLHEAGWRAATEAYDVTICICSAPESEADVETVTKCQNRNCAIEFFHLKCMKLPDHPPRGVGWLCPKCRGGGVDKETGLYDQRKESRWQAWLREYEEDEDVEDESAGDEDEVVRNADSDSTLSPSVSFVSRSESEGEKASPTLKRKRDVEAETDDSEFSSEHSEEWTGKS